MIRSEPERVLVVEDDETRCAWFQQVFSRCHLDMTCDVAEAIKWLREREYSIVFLDHDLAKEHYQSAEADDERTGYAVALWLANNPNCQHKAQIVIHSLNYVGAERMLERLLDAGRLAEHVPFPYLNFRLQFN